MKLPAIKIIVKVVRLTPNFKVLKVPILKIHTYKSTIRKKKPAKKHKCVKAAQYATEQPMCHWRNQTRKKKKIPGGKWKWKQPMQLSKDTSKRKVYCNTSLPRETIKKCQINNLSLHL